MKYFYGTTDFYSEVPTAVTLGKFDGLHLGHQKLINRILAKKEQGLSSTVFVIAPPGVPRLLTSQEKRKMLENAGIDCMIECPFIPEILGMGPGQFVEEVLLKKLKSAYLAVGTDFKFGYQRSGDTRFLSDRQEKYGMQVDVIEKERLDGRIISSTYVREAMQEGKMELVKDLLGYHYSVAGTVRHGRQLGRTIGMPTVNLIPEKDKLLPPNGVYFARVFCGGTYYRGITNIGCKPTVDGSFVGVETYLYDFAGELYDREIVVELLSFRRPERRFDSLESLKEQMRRDVLSGKEYFREH